MAANIQMQKLGAVITVLKPPPAFDLERWTKPLRGRLHAVCIRSFHG
jgi:hypothetical protein